MSNYNSLKTTINANVKTNGNQEITGAVMNSVLTAMVNNLGAGYQYMGVATPSTDPGTPDARVFYIATTAGTYANFGGLQVSDGQVAILKWDTAWHKEVTGAATGASVTQLGESVGEIGATKNYIQDAWTASWGIEPGHAGYIVTDKIPGEAGEKVYLGNMAATRYALAYDASGAVIGYRAESYPSFTLPSNTTHFVVCFGPNATDLFVAKNNEVVWKKTDGPGRLVDIKSLIDEQGIIVDKIGGKADDSYGAIYKEENYTPNAVSNYAVNPDGKLGTNSTYKHVIMSVQEGDVIRIKTTAFNRPLMYAFLTTDTIANTSGESLPLVDGTSPRYFALTGNNGEVKDGEVTVVIPSGCKGLISDIYSSVATRFYIRRNILEDVVSCYKDYIKTRSFEVRMRDITLGQNADSFIFLTDYHIYNGESNIMTNFGHSPALVKYIQKHSNTGRFIFGGDVFTSPGTDEERFRLMDEFLTLFNFTTMYAAVGNHEWRQSSDLGNDGRVYDFGSLAKRLEGLVTFGRDSQGDISQPYYYFDNPSLKIRYFVLYTPGTDENSEYAIFNYTEQLAFLSAKISELDATWHVIVIQHTVYQNGSEGTSVYDAEGYPTKVGNTAVGRQIKNAIIANNTDNTRAKIVCLMSGHIHNDFCEFVDGNCISICNSCDATYLYQNGNYDVYPNNNVRRLGTIYEQLFDVLHVMGDGSKVLSIRIGYGSDKVVNIQEHAVGIGNSLALSPSISPDSWVSQDESIATVANGVVTGVTAGRVTIKARENGTPNGKWEYFNILVS